MLVTAPWAAAAEIPQVKAIDIRSLTPEQVEQGLPLALRGTCIFRDPGNAVFLQDETAGALFWDDTNPRIQPGDVVEIQGTTRAGLYVPGLENVTYRILNHGGMPAPRESTYDDLISGRYHYQWVSVEGIVRSVATDRLGKSNVRLAMGSRIVEVHLRDAPGIEELLDHRIRVTGMAAGGINDRRQLIQPYVWPHDRSGIQVLDAPPAATALATLPASELLTFRATAHSGHRVRVGGIVLASFADGRVFIRDRKTALAIRLTSPAGLQPGEFIQVLGFPEMDRFSAALVDATVVSRSPGEMPPPVKTWVDSIVRGTLNHELVSFDASVIDSFRTEKGASISLRTRDASLRLDTPPMDELPVPGTRLHITGICQVESSRPVAYSSRPEAVAVLVRSLDDLAILKSPPGWTARRLTAVLIALGGLVCLALLWIILLRRQVETQTAALRRKIENEAMLEERQRIAREFHDTLEQDLTGLSLQLGAAAAKSSGDSTRGPLDTARHLISRIQTETRNLLSDLRTPADQALDLATSLEALAAKHPGTAGPRVTFHPSSEIPPLAPRTVHHLRMIAQESVTNALKHARASLIAIDLQQVENRLSMTITDDGCGFEPAAETWEKPGHFGCMGIRERARKLGAEVAWQSAPGQGTTVTVQLPDPV